jgi:hypothetical protein
MMRVRLIGAWLVLVVATSSPATAGTPMTLLLATAHGQDFVAIGTGTARLHGRVWLYRNRGVGTAYGRATISCRTKKTSAGIGGVDESFHFAIAPGAHQEVWRYGGDACTISISLKGQGGLSVTLRGY